MSKRVQFSRTATVYSEEESAPPSPSHSISSLPSSSSPELTTPPPEEDNEETPAVMCPTTPLMMQLQLDPYPPDISPPQKIMQIHFLLAFSPFSDPAVSWDISYPPPIQSPDVDDDRTPLSAETLAEPATSPPLTSLTICHPDLKWRIEVEAKDPAPGAYVSVNDVFTTVFRELRVAIQSIDYVPLIEETRAAVDAAYFARCGRVQDPVLHLLERKKGVKRVDILMGRTKFLGLSGTLSGPEIWELNTS